MTENPAPLPASARRYPRRRFATPRAVMALILREMATTYGRSPGGYLWAVLEPVAGIALLSLIFSNAFASPPLGINFAIFYATGMLPFLMFTDISNKMATALMFSKQLLAYPSVTFIDALAARFILNLLTQLMVGYLLFSGIMLSMETRVLPNYAVIVQAYMLTAALALGIGTLNAFLFTRFRVWQRVWGVLMRPMFIISGIFILPESIPEPYGSWLLNNPLVHVIGIMRRGFYSSYEAPYASPLYVLAVSGITLVLGLVFLRRYHLDLINN